MKKLGILAIVVLVGAACVVGAVSCKKSPKAGEEVTAEELSPKDKATPEVISSELSKSLCKRMIECAPGIMPEEECIAQTTSSLKQAMTEKPLDISKGKLDACIESIIKSTCEEVMGTEPPKGCDFLN